MATDCSLHCELKLSPKIRQLLCDAAASKAPSCTQRVTVGCVVQQLSVYAEMAVSKASLAAPIFAMTPVKNGTIVVAGGGSSKTGIANSIVCVF